jgi:hypothetical protein
MSSTAGVEVKFFSITISLMRYNFVLIFFLILNNVGVALYGFFPSVFHSYSVHSIGVLYSKMTVQTYIHNISNISKPIIQTFIQ